MIVGSARRNENNKYATGAEGDQLQNTTPDYSGEVSLQEFYIHSKGWCVIRPVKSEVAEKMASLMYYACNNENIGYSQNERSQIYTYGVKTTTPCNCDCSSLVCEIAREATGDSSIANFTTATEYNTLIATKHFTGLGDYVEGMLLYEGDILVTKTKGHTVIVSVGTARATSYSIEEIAQQVIEGIWYNGEIRKNLLTQSGYDYNEIQSKVNEILRNKTIEAIAKEVINGLWDNNPKRKELLEAAGYDYSIIQAKVNEMLK